MGDGDVGIGLWGVGIGDWAHSPIPNPQSPIPNPHILGTFKLNLKIKKKLNHFDLHKI